MNPVATISGLIQRIDKDLEKRPEGIPAPVSAKAAYKRDGVEVWAIQYVDGVHFLHHYGEMIMSAERGYESSTWVKSEDGSDTLTLEPMTVPGEFDLYEPGKGWSRSDVQGMNALLEVLGIKERVHPTVTADYGGLKGRR